MTKPFFTAEPALSYKICKAICRGPHNTIIDFDEMQGHVDALLAPLIAENEAFKKEYSKSTCAYCGIQCERIPEQMAAHAIECPKDPRNEWWEELEQQTAKLTEQLRICKEALESISSIHCAEDGHHMRMDWWLLNSTPEKMAETLANDTRIAREALAKVKSLEEK